MSGALVTCPMEGMTGTMTGLGSAPLSSRGVLYGHALYIFFGLCNSAKWKPAGLLHPWEGHYKCQIGHFVTHTTRALVAPISRERLGAT